MNNTLLTIYPLLWFLLVFYKASLAGRGGRNSAFLRPEQTGMIRAAACIGVILHHVTQQISSYGSRDFGPIGIFNYLGILFTACTAGRIISDIFCAGDSRLSSFPSG